MTKVHIEIPSSSLLFSVCQGIFLKPIQPRDVDNVHTPSAMRGDSTQLHPRPLAPRLVVFAGPDNGSFLLRMPQPIWKPFRGQLVARPRLTAGKKQIRPFKDDVKNCLLLKMLELKL